MIGENDGGRYDWECPPGPDDTPPTRVGNWRWQTMSDRTQPPPGLEVRQNPMADGRGYTFIESWTCGRWVDGHGHELWQIVGFGETRAEAIERAWKTEESKHMATKKKNGKLGNVDEGAIWNGELAERAPKIESFVKELRVELRVDEIADRADRAAQLLADRDGKEEEQKAAQKHAKSVIEGLDAEIRRLSNEVRTKATYKLVECERRYDYRLGKVLEVRLDVGEIVFERAMFESERQTALDLDGLPVTQADIDAAAM